MMLGSGVAAVLVAGLLHGPVHPPVHQEVRAVQVVRHGHGNGQRGSATWYCGTRCTQGYPGGLYAAAGSELRTPGWRGRRVTVTAGGRSVVVTLVDTCACKGARIIDLYADAFRRLAPLSRGVLTGVKVTW